MLAAALSAVLLSAAPQLEAGVSAGGGYDSDLNHADTTVSAAGSGFASLKANGGASVDLGESTNLYGGVRFDGETYASYQDLSTAAFGAELSFVQELGAGAAVVLTPWIAQSWSGDAARDATTLAGQAALRVKPVRDLTLRAFYGYTDRNAAEAVFSTVKNRVGAGVEWRALPRTYLSLAGFVERGDETFYGSTTAVAAGQGAGMAKGMGGPFPGQKAYSAAATTRALAPTLEIGIDATFHLLASFDARHVASDAAKFDAYSLFIGLGARL